ncbi:MULTISPECIES: thiamine phosphate synthase [unclassified Chryseobacterium]|uniref:thiamine phosphate synthase n=1 Tax=unclassified Chryseobacterium TaxID=2593645 RepID=UPI000D39A287|nr:MULTISPECIES: thiamine phosphate synthase [unclassified Chryseobacterium]PTT78049.1 thiamine phosphate synthase [Chryseobacterium sp. HMWF001]PVV56832.1 thiamine phosphate synthase [Chryseobacterium sp. HMWF035]
MEKLQYISQGSKLEDQEINIRKALDSGAKWIQVRWKNTPEKDFIRLCEISKKLCADYQAVCIINDHVQIAKDVDADGVHLGLKDMSVEKARHVLGENKIIGGTANTFSDILQRMVERCDYIGLGPLRFTSTKEQLSPILGFEGYGEIINSLKEKSIEIPKIFAIGGVVLEDIKQLQQIGIYGVAVSGQITSQPSVINEFRSILESN